MHAMEERGEYKADYRILWPNGTVRWTDGLVSSITTSKAA